MNATATDKPTERPIYVVTLRPEQHVADPVRALRRALKILLRRFGLRAIEVREDGGAP